MADDDKFDYEWDIKQENGLNVTENKLLEAMKKIGLNPEPQYKISRMTVDFAFPEEKIVIEVNGPDHDREEQKIADKKRYFALKRFGWKRKTFSSRYAYHYPDKVAKEIAELVGKTEILDNHKDIDSQNSSHINEVSMPHYSEPYYPKYVDSRKKLLKLKHKFVAIAFFIGVLFFGLCLFASIMVGSIIIAGLFLVLIIICVVNSRYYDKKSGI